MDCLVKKKKFQDKVVVISGASSGLGLEIAKEFIRENANISLCARRLEKLKKNFKNKKMFFFKELIYLTKKA